MKRFLTAIFAFLGLVFFAFSDASCSTYMAPLLNVRWFSVLYEDHLKYFCEIWCFWVAVGCNAIAFLLQLLPTSPRRILRNYLNLLHRSLFDGDIDRTRITVFRVSRGIHLWPFFVWKNFVCLKKHLKKGTVLYQFLSFPWVPWGKYIVIYARRGKPHEKGTMTIFKYPVESADVDGIVSFAIMQERMYSTSLPDISLIDFDRCKNIDCLDHQKHKLLVKDYIKKSHLKSFAQLKSIHSKSNQIWAMPIVGDDEETWGALVVDCQKDENPFDDYHIKQSLEHATATIYTIIRGR